MPHPPTQSLYDVAYPRELRRAEHDLHPRAQVGIAVSGGGIRSATFALGFFQALARRGLLDQVDYLSTVSGGGYFGAFLGRLFTRDYIRSAADVEHVLGGPHPENPLPADTLTEAGWKVLGWLRENGRYLSPRGSGDLLLGGAVLLRNWVAIHVVLGALIFAAFLLLQLPRVWLSHHWAPAASAVRALGLEGFASFQLQLLGRLPGSPWIWWSPWILVGLSVLALSIAPGWAYWLVRRERSERSAPAPHASSAARRVRRYTARIGVVVSIVIGVAGAVLLFTKDRDVPGTGAGPETIAGITAVVLGALALLAAAWWNVTVRRVAARAARSAHDLTERQQDLQRDADTRYSLSSQTLSILLLGAAICAVALIDSAGQTIYARAQEDTLKEWGVALLAAFGSFAWIARQVVVLVGAKSDGKRPRLPVAMVASAVAILLLAALLISYNVLSHGVAWNFECACGPRARTGLFLAWTAAALLLAWAFGNAFAFLNQSSHQPLYTARLTRAYLGASNERRWDRQAAAAAAGRHPVSEPVPGDDMEAHEYWAPAAVAGLSREARAWAAKNMPLHLVNVTVNETYDGQSQVQQQDRKGTGMALGPAGVSLGIRHHVIVREHARTDPGTHSLRIYAYPEDPGGFRVFEYGTRPGAWLEVEEFPWEPLSLGRWIAISGAAFTTGTGYRTSFGLSMLAGLTNIRLGYWWDSRIDPESRHGRTRSAESLARTWLARFFPVQCFLLDEMTARFPGTAREFWYVSDGGHFENMGAYELIRRRLPVIIVIDAEADPQYGFDGLANLVRKARLDFQTEIEFLDVPELAEERLGALFGTLEQVRPSPAEPPASARTARLSRARCAVARVTYPEVSQNAQDVRQPAPSGWLLYVKPTLLGDEPEDVAQYARTNPPFPQQTTADQFFDEAQWESYRKLGDHIGGRILDDPWVRGQLAGD
ncbi:MAG TPA: hypothetical protein VK886_15060 [Vicinamibacterales bacterium]|nr:hypothetical protein [Vicinamibacterales bacterium]